MARFIPDVAVDDIPYDSERLVYEQLKQLGGQYVVMHSFPWLRPERGYVDEPLGEGEADFVILHPRKGLLVLEVKGGEPELRGRVWYRRGRPLRDPFEQAKRSKYVLLDAIDRRTGGRVARGALTHGVAVVFPHVEYRGNLPLNMDARLVIDRRHLPDLARRIEGAYDAWRRRETNMSHGEFTALLDALVPSLRLMRCVGAQITSEQARIIRATRDQHLTLQGLLANRRVLVQGTAGSGKTLLATHFAVELARQGRRVLFLCYNSALAGWLADQIDRESDFDAFGPRLETSTFHRFALRVARRAGVEFEVPSDSPQEFWRSEAALILEQALDLLDSRARPRFDAVIVDEGQDFLPDWWVTLESLTAGGPNGRLYVFQDTMQSLWGIDSPPPVAFDVTFPLAANCRNTQRIAKSAGEIRGTEVVVLPSCPVGEIPGLRRAPSAAQVKGLVMREVEDLLTGGLSPKQVALIGPKAHRNGCLNDLAQISGTPLVTDAGDWRRGGGVLVTTARSFKGLEADVIVLYDLQGFSDGFSSTDLYVAWTRARHRLVVVCEDGPVRRRVEEALGALGSQSLSA